MSNLTTIQRKARELENEIKTYYKRVIKDDKIRWYLVQPQVLALIDEIYDAIFDLEDFE